MPLKWRHEPSIVPHIPSFLNQVTKFTQNGSILTIFKKLTHLHTNPWLIGLGSKVLIQWSHGYSIPHLSP